ncbi:hypothetical protein SAMN05192561_12013 [Halopenitus malekzadehii]|uniref:DUF8134 domain-containing protein n=1 Tax=Halopenitus malekzadehii TaxID=1267564 RepID=A0A1H6JZH3_9EURY|nr:hypothetical protein [Halopenitus malekzadehii]SEH64812.1 hypothetical protein SAMN05192561_12013 [Halopenitus malekzadehii]
MAISLRTLDDGAWVSVADERRTGVSELWRVRGVCDCPLAEFVVEGITDVAVDGRTVAAGTYGRCIRCGCSTSTTPIPVGRIVDGCYEPIDRDAVRRPVETTRPSDRKR